MKFCSASFRDENHDSNVNERKQRSYEYRRWKSEINVDSLLFTRAISVILNLICYVSQICAQFEVRFCGGYSVRPPRHQSSSY